MSVGNKGGRPRKLIALSNRRISKKDKLERQRQESAIKTDREQLEAAPAWLTDEAKTEYLRVVQEAGKVPFLDNLDLHFVAMYADAYHRYIRAAEQLKKHGDVVKMEDGTVAISPFLAVMKKAEDTIFKCSSRLGLATTDRLRLIVPKVEEKAENKFLKYLKA